MYYLVDFKIYLFLFIYHINKFDNNMSKHVMTGFFFHAISINAA